MAVVIQNSVEALLREREDLSWEVSVSRPRVAWGFRLLTRFENRTAMEKGTMKPRRNWLYIRISAFLLSFLSAFASPMPVHLDYAHRAPASFLLTLCGILAAGVLFVLSLSARSMPSSGLWKRPNWFVSPFDRKQPLVFFDFGAYCMMLYGLGGAVTSLLSNVNNWSWEIPVSAACGVWLGVRISVLVYRNQIERKDDVQSVTPS